MFRRVGIGNRLGNVSDNFLAARRRAETRFAVDASLIIRSRDVHGIGMRKRRRNFRLPNGISHHVRKRVDNSARGGIVALQSQLAAGGIEIAVIGGGRVEQGQISRARLIHGSFSGEHTDAPAERERIVEVGFVRAFRARVFAPRVDMNAEVKHRRIPRAHSGGARRAEIARLNVFQKLVNRSRVGGNHADLIASAEQIVVPGKIDNGSVVDGDARSAGHLPVRRAVIRIVIIVENGTETEPRVDVADQLQYAFLNANFAAFPCQKRCTVRTGGKGNVIPYILNNRTCCRNTTHQVIRDADVFVVQIVPLIMQVVERVAGSTDVCYKIARALLHKIQRSVCRQTTVARKRRLILPRAFEVEHDPARVVHGGIYVRSGECRNNGGDAERCGGEKSFRGNSRCGEHDCENIGNLKFFEKRAGTGKINVRRERRRGDRHRPLSARERLRANATATASA